VYIYLSLPTGVHQSISPNAVQTKWHIVSKNTLQNTRTRTANRTIATLFSSARARQKKFSFASVRFNTRQQQRFYKSV